MVEVAFTTFQRYFGTKLKFLPILAKAVAPANSVVQNDADRLEACFFL